MIDSIVRWLYVKWWTSEQKRNERKWKEKLSRASIITSKQNERKEAFRSMLIRLLGLEKVSENSIKLHSIRTMRMLFIAKISEKHMWIDYALKWWIELGTFVFLRFSSFFFVISSFFSLNGLKNERKKRTKRGNEKWCWLKCGANIREQRTNRNGLLSVSNIFRNSQC